MGGRSRPFPNLEWVEADCEQIAWKNSSCDAQVGPALFSIVLRGLLRSEHDWRTHLQRHRSDVPATLAPQLHFPD